MTDYLKAKELLDFEATDFTGGISMAEIEKAEKELCVKFPESYKAFLCEFGAGDIGGEVLFGMVRNRKKHKDIDMLKITQLEHDYKMPKYMVVIYYNDSDNCLYCLDTSRMCDNECPVVSISEDYMDIKTIANSFGKFFYEMVSDEDMETLCEQSL